jgi:hypothetical protein
MRNHIQIKAYIIKERDKRTFKKKHKKLLTFKNIANAVKT